MTKQHNSNIMGSGKPRIQYTNINPYLIKAPEPEQEIEQETEQENKENKEETTILGDLSFMTDEAMYKEIIKYMDSKFKNHKHKLSQKLSFKDGVMKSSNPYIAIAIDMFLKTQMPEYRIATQRDLETDLQKFKEFYIDSGLVLRSLEGVNQEKARHLYEQLKSRDPKINFPILLNLRDLNLDKDLNFNLTDESLYKTAECLKWPHGTKYSQTDDFGLPKTKDETASRQIWTTQTGLARCYLGRYLNLNTRFEGLEDSSDDGRVVLAKSRSD